jgi:hypothetical protein
MILRPFLLLMLVLLYWFPVRRWFDGWGTTADEIKRSMPGDQVIKNPTNSAMQAVTINAPPEDIWPWLVQLGYQRGGLYSYDWLDRLFGFLDRPSAKRILPEFQHLAVGDKIPWGHGEALTVAAIDRYRALVLAYTGRGMEWVWQFGLYPIDSSRTRLVTRGIERTPTTVPWRLVMLIMELAAFIMTRRMLLNLKQRAEELTSFRAASSTEVPPAASGGST